MRSGYNTRLPAGTPMVDKLTDRVLNSESYTQSSLEELEGVGERVCKVEARDISSVSPWKLCMRCWKSLESAEGEDKTLIRFPDGRGEVQHMDGTSTRGYNYIHMTCPAPTESDAEGAGTLAPNAFTGGDLS